VRRGFALHEMIVSLTVMGVILIIAAHFSSRQLGFLRGMSGAATVRNQLTESTATIAAILANVHPAAGDILLAQDTVLEVRLTTGIGAACAGAPGVVVIPAGSEENAALAAFLDPPRGGDRLDALLADSSGTTWLSFQIVGVVSSEQPCAAFPGVPGTMAVAIAEPFAVPARAPLRFTRPFRLSHYRSADGKWYLGGRDWNEADQRFNTVQPLAGPLRARGAEAVGGLTLRYLDRHGAFLTAPVEPRQVAAVSIVVRAPVSTLRGQAPDDSVVTIVALRP